MNLIKNSIGNQLLFRGIIILLFILLLTAAGQVCISILNTTSGKVFEEYKELDVLQEYRSNLGDISFYFDEFILNRNEETYDKFRQGIKNAFNQLEKCNLILTERHDKTLLNLYKNELIRIDSLKNILSDFAIEDENIIPIHSELMFIINEGINESDKLLAETKIEIEEYIQTSKTAVKHSTLTIIIIGLLFLFIISFGGMVFIRKLTLPIASLLKSTQKVGQGRFETTFVTNTNKEFTELAESFNDMINRLEKTTISRNYYDNILRNMLEPLIVTDTRGIIQSVNQVTLEILKYDNEDLVGRSLIAILHPESEIFSSDGKNENSRFRLGKSEQKLLTKDGREITVLLSVSTINDDSGAIQQYIFVAHDLTEKINSERILENERKEKLIAIHDAQEEEKFRIAVDLHDGLGQILTATSYSFQYLFGELNKDDDEYQKKVNLVTSQLDNAVRETKIIARNLIPLALKDFGLLVAVNNLVEQATLRSGIIFTFDSYNFTSRIDSKLEKALFRIFQEATNNIIKHSQAQTASFQINKYDDIIVISIEDDGVGFDLNKLTVEKKQKGIGLMGMRERILAFNGSFTINSKPGSGTEILIEIPCRNEI